MDTGLAAEANAWERLRRGADPDALTELFRTHSRSVYNFCFRRLADWDAAEDATQATFLALWRRAAAGRVEPLRAASERAVLLGMARQECQTVARGKLRRDRLAHRLTEQPPTVTEQTPEEWWEAVETMREIRRALAVLSAGQRDVVELVCWSGLGVTEASVALGLPTGTVKSRLSRARAALAAANFEYTLGGAK